MLLLYSYSISLVQQPPLGSVWKTEQRMSAMQVSFEDGPCACVSRCCDFLFLFFRYLNRNGVFQPPDAHWVEKSISHVWHSAPQHLHIFAAMQLVPHFQLIFANRIKKDIRCAAIDSNGECMQSFLKRNSMCLLIIYKISLQFSQPDIEQILLYRAASLHFNNPDCWFTLQTCSYFFSNAHTTFPSNKSESGAFLLTKQQVLIIKILRAEACRKYLCAADVTAFPAVYGFNTENPLKNLREASEETCLEFNSILPWRTIQSLLVLIWFCQEKICIANQI